MKHLNVRHNTVQVKDNRIKAKDPNLTNKSYRGGGPFTEVNTITTGMNEDQVLYPNWGLRQRIRHEAIGDGYLDETAPMTDVKGITLTLIG